MNYTKPPLTIEKQADLLLSRGLIGDREIIKARLTAVNYYRLSGYWYPFRNPDDTFRPGTTIDSVWNLYVFDRHLRLLVMDALERIEISVRSLLAYHHSHQHGPFGYAIIPASLPKFSEDRRKDFLFRVKDETERSKETFVEHFKTKYGDAHQWLPVWMAAEVMSFGTILTFYRGAPHKIKQAVASEFKMPEKVFDSWLLSLNTVRNICAHHGRLWNREFGVKPLIPFAKDYPEWHSPIRIENRRVFSALTICRHCLRCIAPQSKWAQRLIGLLNEYPGAPSSSMGFPVDWNSSRLWQLKVE